MRRTSNIKTHLKFHESRNRETNELFALKVLEDFCYVNQLAGVSMICLPVDWLAKSWAGAVDLVILQILPEAEAALLWLGLGLLEAVEAVVRL